MKAILVFSVLTMCAAGGNLYFERHFIDESIATSASSNWPTVSGLITSSSLRSPDGSGIVNVRLNLQADIRYEYVVADQLYRNDVVRFDQHRLSNRQKRLLVSDFPVGKRVDVYYDPDDPRISVLVPGPYPEHR